MMVETGRLIQRRYLLQRLLQQGQSSTIYQGTDQLLQRPVAVKAVPAASIPAYRTAIRLTSQFSHPNIIGIYDVIPEPDMLYVIQEYVEGDSFSTLLQAPLSAYEVADLGIQLCQALIYAGSGARTICHGDLTPTAVMRDRRGLVRLSNFALPSDVAYFTSWSVVGGDGIALSDTQLPLGQQSEGRRADDCRAVGILLYQLLAGRSASATTVEPPPDGRLRFMRNVPPDLCELVARAVLRQHPQHIVAAEQLYAELKTLQEQLEPPLVAVPDYVQEVSPAARAVPGAPATGKLISSLPARESVVQASPALPAFRPDTSARVPTLEPNSAATVAEMPLKLVTARQAAYPAADMAYAPARRLSFPVLLGLGLLVFLFFFAVGYFIATAAFHP
jgi:serine/threonine protein kinase